jgi:hypothetical protein
MFRRKAVGKHETYFLCTSYGFRDKWTKAKRQSQNRYSILQWGRNLPAFRKETLFHLQSRYKSRNSKAKLSLVQNPDMGTDWTQLSRSYLKTETECSLRNTVFWKNKHDSVLDKDKTMDNVQKRNIFTNVPPSRTLRSYSSHSLNQLIPPLLRLLFDSEDGGGMFLRNVGKLLSDYVVPHPIRWVHNHSRDNSKFHISSFILLAENYPLECDAV